jgi:hypothetical protein
VVAPYPNLCGLVASFGGATTVTLGSEPEFVCDTAGTLRTQSSVVDRMATADSATKLDEILMTLALPIRT